MTPEESFAVLGIAATMDGAAVKTAYFVALKKHPPHADPQGFRRLRTAYEQLSSPEVRAAAYMASPAGAEHETASFVAKLDERVTSASSDVREARAIERLIAEFEATVPIMSYANALARFAGDRTPRPPVPNT